MTATAGRGPARTPHRCTKCGLGPQPVGIVSGCVSNRPATSIPTPGNATTRGLGDGDDGPEPGIRLG